MAHSPRFVSLVDRTRALIIETDAETVHDRLSRAEPFTLVDVREQAEWDRGHLPGAVHVARGVLERDAETTFPESDAPLVLYCGGGYRSALAAKSLQDMGYSNVASMDGGWRAWSAAGYPTDGGQGADG